MNEKLSNAGEQGDQRLLPGIPNEITVGRICTKLPWKAFYILSVVSPAWRQALQSHLVYDTRVGYHSTETLLVHNHFREATDDSCQVVALYSVRDKRCYELPEIPGVERGIPFACECISLDGRIYVLGGAKEYDIEEDEESKFESILSRCDDDKEAYKEVYVFDLAGQRQWTQCASMLEGRHRFACGVMNGKIYVFGGAGNSGPVGSEVYDPQGNTWSPIKPMPRLRFRDHRVTILGEELAIYGGVYYDTKTAEEAKENEYSNHEWIGYDFTEEALYLEVYHPLKDEWRVVEPFVKDYLKTRTVFEAGGKLHIMTPRGVSVYDGDKTSWKLVYKNSFSAVGPTESIQVVPCATAVANDKLYAGVGWYRNDNRTAFGTCLVEGARFGSESKKIRWQILTRCRCECVDIMYTMQL